jgi:hypothetical protein
MVDMSNVKEVLIEADVSYNILDDKTIVDKLGRIMLNPMLGLKVQVWPIPSGNDGKSKMKIVIKGQEAVSWGFLQTLCEDLKAYGKLLKGEAKDMEAETVSRGLVDLSKKALKI